MPMSDPNEQVEEARELLKSWVEVARSGEFNGEDFEECDTDCDCIVCQTEKFLG